METSLDQIMFEDRTVFGHPGTPDLTNVVIVAICAKSRRFGKMAVAHTKSIEGNPPFSAKNNKFFTAVSPFHRLHFSYAHVKMRGVLAQPIYTTDMRLPPESLQGKRKSLMNATRKFWLVLAGAVLIMGMIACSCNGLLQLAESSTISDKAFLC